jgi:peptide chain release factor 1
MSLDDRLEALERRYVEIQDEFSKPEVAADPDRLRDLGREQSSLEDVVSAYRRAKEVRASLASAREAESDPELRELARAEIDQYEREEEELVQRLRVLLLPNDPNDEKNVIVEIRAGAGGEEAALFAAQLFRMFKRYAERHRWQTEVLTANETGIGGLREVIFEVRGHGAYSRLKYEGGVHRVQRVPETESSGRIHTSTATVAVLPEADEVEVQLDEE